MNKFIKKIGSFFENKNSILMFLITFCVVVIVIFFLFMLFNDTGLFVGISNPDAIKIENEYEELNGITNEEGKPYPKVNISSSNILRYANTREDTDLFVNGGDAVVYFGYPSCVYCRSAVQVLCDTAKGTELDKIYYLDVEELDDTASELMDYLGDRFVLEEDGKKKIYAPLVIFIANGNVVSHNKGTLFSQEDPYTELDDSQVDGLSEIYRYGINDVINSIKAKRGEQ